jgi:hypothetical protein
MTLRLMTVLAAACTAALSIAALAFAAPTENSWIPVAFTTDTSCTGEPIAFEGTMHLMLGETETANGSHRRGHANERLKGIGLLSGATYIGTINVHSNSNISASPHQSGNLTLTSNVHVVRVGESAQFDDYSEHIIVRFTINGIAEEKAFADEFRSSCN